MLFVPEMQYSWSQVVKYETDDLVNIIGYLMDEYKGNDIQKEWSWNCELSHVSMGKLNIHIL